MVLDLQIGDGHREGPPTEEPALRQRSGRPINSGLVHLTFCRYFSSPFKTPDECYRSSGESEIDAFLESLWRPEKSAARSVSMRLWLCSLFSQAQSVPKCWLDVSRAFRPSLFIILFFVWHPPPLFRGSSTNPSERGVSPPSSRRPGEGSLVKGSRPPSRPESQEQLCSSLAVSSFMPPSPSLIGGCLHSTIGGSSRLLSLGG